MFTLDEFLNVLRQRGAPDRVVYLVQKYPDEIEPFLDKIHKRLVAKGLLTATPEGGDGALTDDERALVPYLRELDTVLREGGHDAAMERLRQYMGDPAARELFRKAAA
jgi:hypothetical protein